MCLEGVGKGLAPVSRNDKLISSITLARVRCCSDSTLGVGDVEDVAPVVVAGGAAVEVADGAAGQAPAVVGLAPAVVGLALAVRREEFN